MRDRAQFGREHPGDPTGEEACSARDVPYLNILSNIIVTRPLPGCRIKRHSVHATYHISSGRRMLASGGPLVLSPGHKVHTTVDIPNLSFRILESRIMDQEVVKNSLFYYYKCYLSAGKE